MYYYSNTSILFKLCLVKTITFNCFLSQENIYWDLEDCRACITTYRESSETVNTGKTLVTSLF